MWARLNRWQVPADDVDTGVEGVRTYLVEEAVPEVRERTGYLGSYSFVEREAGEGITISFWDSEEHLRASEANAARQRREAKERAGGDEAGMTRLEVIHSDTFELPRSEG